MTEKQLKGYVLRLFKFKSISSKQFMNARNNLEQLKESDPLFYYFNMGKLQTAFGNIDAAIEYLNKAIQLKPDHASAYYNLYKCYVKKGDVNAALDSLTRSFEYNKHVNDFTFPIQIMRTMQFLDIDYLTYLNSDFSVSEGTKIGYNDLNDNEKLATLYKSVLKAFNERNYVECLQKLRVMDTIINETNYPMEVDTLIGLVKLLKEKEVSSCKRALSDQKMENASAENFCKFQLRLLELGHYNEESFLRMVEGIIGNDDVERAEKLLNGFSANPKFSKYLDMVEYLRGFIREKCAFLFLPDEKQDEFITRRLKAKSLYKKKKNDESLEAYAAIKNDFCLPICDYYIGKILFRQGKFSQAKEMFLSYLEQGGTKAEKAYMFLGKIERIQKNKGESRRYINMMHKIHRVFGRDFDFISEKNYKKRKKIGTSEDIYDQHDDVKKKKSRYIKMSEDDFILSDSFSVESFYDVGVDGKLSIIRGLLQTGNERVANKLFEEVQRECAPEERGKVKQFERNRKIYRNQNRTTIS